MVNTYSVSKDGNFNVSTNFKIKEFRCKDGSDTILLDSLFVVTKLQVLRDYFNKPVCINSAYRTPAYNKRIGGANNSYHMKGQAFDIVIKDIPLDEICKQAQKIGINGIIRYNTFVHLDNRSTKYYATNNNGIVKKVDSFL